MPGIANADRVASLDTIYGVNLYLRLLRWTGVTAPPADICANDDGSLPANVVEVSGGGYAPQLVLSTNWSAAVAGTPTQKQVPKTGGTPIVFTNTGTTWVNVCAYCWTTDTNPISSTNFKGGNPLSFASGSTYQTVVSGRTITFDDANPIFERLGDPPPGVNPT